MMLDEIQEGLRVLYMPRHAQGKRTHPDCQRGIITGKTAPQVLVRYGTDRHRNATATAFLVPDTPGGPGFRGLLPPSECHGGARRHAKREAGGETGGGEAPTGQPCSLDTTRDDRGEEHPYGRLP